MLANFTGRIMMHTDAYTPRKTHFEQEVYVIMVRGCFCLIVN